MDATKRLTPMRPPVWTLLVCAGAAVIYWSPTLRPLLIFDRIAIARGELWRLVTGNLVHFSAAHLCFDLAALFIAGVIIETRGYRRFPVLCLTSAACIGIVLYYTEPAMYYYAGLSGVSMAAVAYLCLRGLTEKGVWHRLCAMALAVVTVKLGIELVFGKFLLRETGVQEFIPVPLSHLAGVMTALLFFVVERLSGAGPSSASRGDGSYEADRSPEHP
jgi:rhomboid family GlyGly-CTERM serine protease